MWYFCIMIESNRQKKIAGVLQNDLANVLQGMLRDSGQLGIIISVSKVKVTTDLSIAKVYVSVFPADKAEGVTGELNTLKSNIKHQIAQLTRHQLRKMPDLHFYNDDSLEYIEKIEKAVKGDENPLENINNTKKINSVFLNGVLYDSKKINELKEFTKSIASSFHMNAKTLKSLISSPLVRVQFAD